MVKSNINESIQYIEKQTIDPEDKGHSTSMYVIELFEIEILIVLGKPKYTYSTKGIVYYPIYLVSNKKIHSRIGIYETKINNSISLVDEDGDIDIDKLGEPLLFSFVSKKYIESINHNNIQDFATPIKDDTGNDKKHDKALGDKDSDIVKDRDDKKQDKALGDKDSDSDSDSDDDDDVLSLKVSKDKKSSPKKVDANNVFTIDTHYRRPETFIEETEKDADEIRKKYRESSSNMWIEKFMKNNNYSIVDNEGGGDCLFAVIRDAYSHIGYNTSVSKLRELLASQLTLEKFENDRKLYLQFETRKAEIKSNMAEIKKNIEEYGKRAKKIDKTNKVDYEELVNAAKELATNYDIEKKELKKTQKDQMDYAGDMANIDTLDKYRDFMKTSNYWADAWAIATLEALLKMKLIIFSEEAYKQGFNDGVLNCGMISHLLEGKQFDPEYYIMTTYSGDHYRLITYKDKHIFNYKEIPYNAKILVVNKCLENNAGIYYKIQDFRNLKATLGINPDAGLEEDSDADDTDDKSSYTHLYNKSAVFVFHEKSLASAKPGAGTGETIDPDRRADFTVLAKIPNWRRKLDDFWTESPFRLDNHTWASVEHYVQGSRFKKGFPDFYLQFSLDNPGELSRNPELAAAAADIRKPKHKALRPENVKEDVDYSLGRNMEEREEALRAKFTQHDDLKHLLHSTRDALLKQYLRRQPAKDDVLLMKIRQEIRSQTPDR